MPAKLRDRYFVQTQEGVAIASEVKALIAFRRLNLAHPPYPMTGPLDAIFCYEGLSSLVPVVRRRVYLATRALLADQGVFRPGFESEDLTLDVAAATDDWDVPPHRIGHC